ncbi:hypothetical protein PFICI_12161 [Pestalotiopsis fici W106-1]|uniref:Uncharacterized protein n=1 Tax=Pestalotiopsis fici (strain W106-1 / CGMCC3.15140) TaxID=1229662 RepID=W3WSJ7_PESFW|nr:uncharacterized protein PFICI_12161 [Pestalotiopsis fici W106-1]ETS76774.1 hypothetical protein PFICI_12161 [Pestalotiopsis fici W106-1]
MSGNRQAKGKTPVWNWRNGPLYDRPPSCDRDSDEAPDPEPFAYASSSEAQTPNSFVYPPSSGGQNSVNDMSSTKSQRSVDNLATGLGDLGFQSQGGYDPGQQMNALMHQLSRSGQDQYLSPETAAYDSYGSYEVPGYGLSGFPSSLHMSSGSISRASPGISAYGDDEEDMTGFNPDQPFDSSSQVRSYRNPAYASSSRDPPYPHQYSTQAMSSQPPQYAQVYQDKRGHSQVATSSSSSYQGEGKSKGKKKRNQY